MTTNESRLRVVILLLLTALLCAGAAGGSMIMQRGGDAPPHAQSGSSPTSLFVESGSGLWGVKSATGRVLIEPEWYSLRLMSSDVLIARRDGSAHSGYGLLHTNGDLIVPLIYTSFHQMTDDIWAAELSEGNKECYHLYHADGTRWLDAAWDTCTYDDGILTLTEGRNEFSYMVSGGRLLRQSWYTEHAVGLHTIRMAFSEGSLKSLPGDDVLRSLGDSAAEYLKYLFLAADPPDASLLTAEDTASLRVGRLYRNCTLAMAEVSRVAELQNGGYPSYLMQIQVTYKRNHDEGKPEVINTAFYLTITRNAAGAYTYSGFADTQMAAAPGSVTA